MFRSKHVRVLRGHEFGIEAEVWFSLEWIPLRVYLCVKGKSGAQIQTRSLEI